ncbi:MAG: DinB family protein [candidate division NC10 bacterium]|nr:DinB family protein [candidate division NC10 bacterium]MBI2457911.1 DinB family protein [candidate division NC10 bacterium]MBI3085180.1 DinB family protein [candidate division NC10 bacterium]
MDRHTRQALIEKYRDGYRVVSQALQGVSEQELDARPAPGKWSAREIVHHLADSEMTSAIRLRRLIAEDRPMWSAGWRSMRSMPTTTRTRSAARGPQRDRHNGSGPQRG